MTDRYPFSPRLEVLPLVPAEAGTVLDVGCGRGGFGFALRQHRRGRSLWAVESDPVLAAEAAPQYDRMIVGSYPGALSDEVTRFDCIVFNDVLEHMVDPWQTLRATREHLSPSGVVVASLPNVRNAHVVIDLVLRGDWHYTEMGILDRTHLRFFTRKTMMSLFTEAGYDVEAIRGINAIGHTRYRFWRVFPIVLGDFAYSGFAVLGRPRTCPETRAGQPAP